MLKFCGEGVIFILIRKLAAPVALIVAWIGVTSFAFVKFNEGEKESIKYAEALAVKVSEEISEIEEEEKLLEEAEKEKEENVETQNLARGSVTSRSGSRNDRDEVNVVYYADLNLNIADNEIEMLERIVQAEAGGSGYDGMLAVANVVLNRVQCERFPDTVTEVIFANRQFTPVSDGRYYTVTVSDTAKQVVQDALSGARIVEEGAYYFCTPTAPGKGWFETSLRKIGYIAPHNFYGYN